jgi:Glu-tRNA(Gln) amidotransferase subunit E-like FAD-binding protein
MSKVRSREELKDYCLRRLGFPVIEINVSEG